jgi:hypothetical protein
MDDRHISATASGFARNTLVAPARELGGVQSPRGDLVPVEKLGAGIVEEVEEEAEGGRVRVHWTDAGFDAWMESQELQVVGSNARILTVNQYDKHGQSKLLRRKVVVSGAFAYSWTVEIRPSNVVRAVRADGSVWTFTYVPLFRRLQTPDWSVPPEDDDAEALTAAELAMFAAK